MASAAHDAARTGDADHLTSLLDANEALVRSKDKLQRQPLHLAAWAGHTQCVVLSTVTFRLDQMVRQLLRLGL